jgi:membrane protein required for colicin V production
MNWLDIALVIVLVSSVAAAFARGFVRESIGLAAAFIGLLCGAWFYRMPSEMLKPYLASREAANLCGFLLIFLGVILLGWIVGRVIRMAVKVVGLSWLDRLLGAAFGAARGVIICVGVITAIVAFAPGMDPKSPPQVVVNSGLTPYLIDTAHVLTMAAPKELRDEFARRYEQVKHVWDDAMKNGLRRVPESEI